MDIDMLMVMIFIVVITAIVLGVGNDSLNRWLRHKELQMELMAKQTAEQAARYAANSEKLEQRVRVLERIATDRGADLATQIEDLRDEMTPKDTVQ